MSRSHEAAVRQKCHAREFTLFWRLKDVENVHFLRIPEADSIVEGASNDFGFVTNLLLSFILESLWVQTDDFEDGVGVAFNVLGLLAHFDSEGFHAALCKAEQDPVLGALAVNIDDLDFTVANLLLDGVLLAHVHICDVNVSEFIGQVEEFLFFVPANGSVEDLMRIRHAEELILFCAITPNGLIIPNRESTALFFDVEDLQEPKLMNTLHLIFELEFTFLAPLFRCFELEEGPFRVSSIDTKFFGIVYF